MNKIKERLLLKKMWEECYVKKKCKHPKCIFDGEFKELIENINYNPLTKEEIAANKLGCHHKEIEKWKGITSKIVKD